MVFNMRKFDKLGYPSYLSDAMKPAKLRKPGFYMNQDFSHLTDLRNVQCEASYKDVFPDTLTFSSKPKGKDENTGKMTYTKYADIPVAFDIEVTSDIQVCINGRIYPRCMATVAEVKRGNGFYKKAAWMYSWQISFMNTETKIPRAYIGRTWEEFEDMVLWLRHKYDLSYDKRLVWVIHNLSYEFQFLKSRFIWDKVSAREKRHVMRCADIYGFEFWDSYVLAASSLAVVAHNLEKFRVRKTKEKFDYSLIRSSMSELSADEKRYCINDVTILSAYMYEQTALYDMIISIPMTNTGRVRRLVQKACKSKSYRQLMKMLTLDYWQYELCEMARGGGLTLGSPQTAGDILEWIFGVDFVSDYPDIIITCDQFPMSAPLTRYNITLEEFDNARFANKFFVCSVTFKNIKQKRLQASPVASSKCIFPEEITPRLNNGKLFSAEKVSMSISSTMFQIIKQFYKWDDITINAGIEWQTDYLPRELVNVVAYLYKRKADLKTAINDAKEQGRTKSEIAALQTEYALAKSQLNSCYGMLCQRLLTDKVDFVEDWDEDTVSLDNISEDDKIDELKRYSNMGEGYRKRFSYMPWAICIVDEAKLKLCRIIAEAGKDFVYGDTDSAKIQFVKKHEAFIDAFNKEQYERVERACDHFKFDDETRDVLLHNEGFAIGCADKNDMLARKFKHYGAKRYLYQDMGGDIHVTVAGVQKAAFEKYLRKCRLNYQDPFEVFKATEDPIESLNLSPEWTGKQSATYIDEPTCGFGIDYQGNFFAYEELGSVYMEGASYCLSLCDEYQGFLYDFENGVFDEFLIEN